VAHAGLFLAFALLQTGTAPRVVRAHACQAVVLVLHAYNPTRVLVASPRWAAPRAGASPSLKQRAARGMGALPVLRSALEG
jgi:hypothetical protein